MHDTRHPDPELIDRLRAGLLDERPADKAALEAHLSDCSACRACRDSWRQLSPDRLGGPRHAGDALSHELAAVRRQALRAASARRRFRGIPAYATAALLLIALGAGLLLLQPALQDDDRLAAFEEDSIPDPYEDLDFYLWLANQDESGDKQENGRANST
jgi:anti-sigma factor RsiW